MEVETLTNHTVRTIVERRRESGSLRFPDEYQRAEAWSPLQKKMFIDSVFRGYSIPAFYFHYHGSFKPFNRPEIPQHDVIDGQQRIRAIHEFAENGFNLLDPHQDSEFKFPNLTKNAECLWSGKNFEQLSDKLKDQFLDQAIVIYEIKTSNDDEVRDLFIRLQGGTPLSPQDKRDAWPGNFTNFILTLGGKPPLNSDSPDKYPGHPFFRNLVKGKVTAKKRQMAAQVAMTYFYRMDDENYTKNFCEINSQNIDNFYHRNINFNPEERIPQKFEQVLSRLVKIFSGHPANFVGHEVIHLVLLTSSLLDDYALGWESSLPRAFLEFRKRCEAVQKAVKNNQESEYIEYWKKYSNWTRTAGDQAARIQMRHEFFVSEMFKLLTNVLKKKDENRLFSRLEKEIIYDRDKRHCQVCRMSEIIHTVFWDEAEFHHVIPHGQGGKTEPSNGALVHKECHPKSKEDVARFQQWWVDHRFDVKSSLEEYRTSEKKLADLPSQTKCRFTYRGNQYNGEILNGRLSVPDIAHSAFNTFSGASKAITKLPRNGWTDWELQLPGSDSWLLADDWRKNCG